MLPDLPASIYTNRFQISWEMNFEFVLRNDNRVEFESFWEHRSELLRLEMKNSQSYEAIDYFFWGKWFVIVSVSKVLSSLLIHSWSGETSLLTQYVQRTWPDLLILMYREWKMQGKVSRLAYMGSCTKFSHSKKWTNRDKISETFAPATHPICVAWSKKLSIICFSCYTLEVTFHFADQ